MKRGGIITLWLVGAGLLAGLAVVFGPRLSGLFGPKKDPMTPGPPHASLTFGDGYRLEVFGLGRGEWIDGNMSPGSGWSIGMSGSSSEVLGFEVAGLRINRREWNGELTGIRYYFEDGEPALVSLRLLKPSGVPLETASWAEDELEVRLIDADGGHLLGLGPAGADDDPGHRAVAIWPAWPRSNTELVFEATRPGQPPRTFRFPNPVAGASPAPWTPAPLPQTRTGADWELTLEEVGVREVPDHGELLTPDFDFVSRIPKTDEPWPPVSGQGAGLECGRGTKTGNRYSGGQKGFRIPSDEDLFKFRYRITYGPTYPYPRRDAHILLVGKADPAGGRIDVTSRHPAFGIDTIGIGPLGTPAGSRRKASHTFTMSFSGKWSGGTSRSAAESVLGPWDDWAWVVFLDGSAKAIGESDSKGWSNSSSGTFDRQGEWTGTLKPGTKVEVGLVRGKPDEFAEFVIDRSALTPR